MNTIAYLRQFRFGEYAFFDLSISFLGMWLISPILTKACRKIGIDIPKKNWVILTLPIGIVFHLLFGAMTPFTRSFLDLNGHLIEKGVVTLSILFGFFGIKRIHQK